jgi:hypothetical protein
MNLIVKDGLTPNQLYLLTCMKESIQPTLINVGLELRLLNDSEYVSNENIPKITQKGIDILNKYELSTKLVKKDTSQEYLDNIKKYLEIWPKGKLPSGKQARTAVGNLEECFSWFIKRYPDYSWETILKATEHYVDEYERKNYLYMKSSQYFIRKQLSDKSWDSELANYCNMIITGDVDNNSTYFSESVK